jgi:hypothetical protein
MLIRVSCLVIAVLIPLAAVSAPRTQVQKDAGLKLAIDAGNLKEMKAELKAGASIEPNELCGGPAGCISHACVRAPDPLRALEVLLAGKSVPQAHLDYALSCAVRACEAASCPKHEAFARKLVARGANPAAPWPFSKTTLRERVCLYDLAGMRPIVGDALDGTERFLPGAKVRSNGLYGTVIRRCGHTYRVDIEASNFGPGGPKDVHDSELVEVSPGRSAIVSAPSSSSGGSSARSPAPASASSAAASRGGPTQRRIAYVRTYSSADFRSSDATFYELKVEVQSEVVAGASLVRGASVLGFRPTTGMSGEYKPCPGGCDVDTVVRRIGYSDKLVGFSTRLGNIDLYFPVP